MRFEDSTLDSIPDFGSSFNFGSIISDCGTAGCRQLSVLSRNAARETYFMVESCHKFPLPGLTTRLLPCCLACHLQPTHMVMV